MRQRTIQLASQRLALEDRLEDRNIQRGLAARRLVLDIVELRVPEHTDLGVVGLVGERRIHRKVVLALRDPGGSVEHPDTIVHGERVGGHILLRILLWDDEPERIVLPRPGRSVDPDLV
jgi:hypothetical protein